MSWADDEISKLRELWDAGASASKIAVALPGKTRNAVIGKAHRLGLACRESPLIRNMPPEEAARRRQEQHRKRKEREKAARRALGIKAKPAMARFGPRKHAQRVSAPTLPTTAAKPASVPASHRAPLPTHRTCQWIAGEPTHDDSCKCGAPTYGGAYCETHYRRAFDWRATTAAANKAAKLRPAELERVA